MRYKVLALLASMMFAGVAQAAHTDNGFYLGVDAGAANLMDKESHSVASESHQLAAAGPVFGAYLGYDYGITNTFRLALEAFLDATLMQTSIQHAPNTYNMNQLYNMGIRLLPAYVFTAETTGHFIVGYTNGRFKIKDNGVYGMVNSTYNTCGLQFGFGADTALINNFFVRLDALYDIYNSDTKTGTGLAPAASQFYTNRFSQLAGELSVYYKFA